MEVKMEVKHHFPKHGTMKASGVSFSGFSGCLTHIWDKKPCTLHWRSPRYEKWRSKWPPFWHFGYYAQHSQVGYHFQGFPGCLTHIRDKKRLTLHRRSPRYEKWRSKWPSFWHFGYHAQYSQVGYLFQGFLGCLTHIQDKKQCTLHWRSPSYEKWRSKWPPFRHFGYHAQYSQVGYFFQGFLGCLTHIPD